ncbi:hypothetical protein N7471_000742 [Penicillium samsonianum]|uniref:uncharacterized protein n=1 Tax=Penicillium samsonianum TaxID=1882272 RepID=UPI002547D648|nr:uncharacterized protein N7471_000742 [Penicillium samsonianum]KAJ6149543.1 hypothetical protein N7471_000742 [Penicillium samsonianum]
MFKAGCLYSVHALFSEIWKWKDRQSMPEAQWGESPLRPSAGKTSFFFTLLVLSLFFSINQPPSSSYFPFDIPVLLALRQTSRDNDLHPFSLI